jgi:hypothetical protein
MGQWRGRAWFWLASRSSSARVHSLSTPRWTSASYAHFAWRFRDGFAKGEINSMAQTPDGYLWLATEFGLLRFDGSKAVPWQPLPVSRSPLSVSCACSRRMTGLCGSAPELGW